jgi:hypothetical protein
MCLFFYFEDGEGSVSLQDIEPSTYTGSEFKLLSSHDAKPQLIALLTWISLARFIPFLVSSVQYPHAHTEN